MSKYKRGDWVEFQFDEEFYIGIVEVVDVHGTVLQNEEPSYDILSEKKLFKNIKESWVKKEHKRN